MGMFRKVKAKSRKASRQKAKKEKKLALVGIHAQIDDLLADPVSETGPRACGIEFK